MKIFPRNLYKMPADKWESNCPFCNLDEDNIIWKWKYFYIQHNRYPYLWSKEHLMAIPYRHVCETSLLTNEEFSEFREIEKFMKEFFWDKKYLSLIRQSWLAKSINHLHYHYLPGEMYAEDIEEILFRRWVEKNTNFQ